MRLKSLATRLFVHQPIIELIEAETRLHASLNYPSLLQIMVYRLIGAKPLFESLLEHCKLNPYGIIRNPCIFIQENLFQNVVWKMAAVLSQPQCVNQRNPESPEILIPWGYLGNPPVTGGFGESTDDQSSSLTKR